MKKLLFILLGFTSLSIYANGCGGQFDPITGTCRIIGVDGKVVIYNSAPPQSTPPPQKIIRYTTIEIPSLYGAIASDKKSGSVGDSLNMKSLEEAKKAALQQCQKDSRAHSCKVIAWVRNGCLAMATGKKGSQFKTTQAAEQPGFSEQVAMERCIKTGASNCQILIPESCSIP